MVCVDLLSFFNKHFFVIKNVLAKICKDEKYRGSTLLRRHLKIPSHLNDCNGVNGYRLLSVRPFSSGTHFILPQSVNGLHPMYFKVLTIKFMPKHKLKSHRLSPRPLFSVRWIGKSSFSKRITLFHHHFFLIFPPAGRLPKLRCPSLHR